MNSGSYVFSQLVKLLPKDVFDWIVKKYDGDKYVKQFTCWNQLLVMMFGQLSECESLRELVSLVTAHARKSHHLGFGKELIKLANLAKANANRDYHIFEEFAFKLIDIAQNKRVSTPFQLNGKFYAFDSTTIDLCLSVFCWAKFRKTKSGILCDQTIRLTGYQTRKKYPGLLRRIVFYSEEHGRTFTYITNAFYLKAKDIAMLYRKRWAVELFFKWIKQHLHIKSFWGNTENAVRIQIYTAVSTYCLVAIAEHDCQLGRSLFDVLRILRGSLLDKTPIRELFITSPEEPVNLYESKQIQLEFNL